MDLDPRRLLVLNAVARHGGVTEAARALGQTRSAVSQQLTRLEREAGVPLLDRTGTRLRLTALGRRLAGAGDRIARELASAADQLRRAGAELRGPVTIGANSWVLARIAARTAEVLAERHLHIVPRFVETDSADGPDRLRLGELDVLALSDDRQTALPLPPSVRARLLMEDAYRLVVPSAWELPSDDPAALSARPWITAPPHTARGRALARFAAAHRIVPSAEHVAEHPVAVRALLAAGFGVTLMPAYFAAQLPGVRLTSTQVPGSFVVRVLHHTPDHTAEAAADALLQSGRDHAEQESLQGRAINEPVIRPLLDPSETSGTSETSEPRGT